MAVEGPNLQGAGVRQVIVQTDAAVQAQLVRREAPPVESAARPLAHLGDRLQAERNQNVGEDLFVQKQDDDQKYSAGDALNGNGRQDGQSRRHRRPKTVVRDPSYGDDVPAESEDWSELGDPREAQERLLKALGSLPLAQSGEVFAPMDRHLLSGLLLPEVATGAVGGLAAYRKQAVLIEPGPEAFRLAVQGAQKAAELYATGLRTPDRELARKLISLSRQGIRTSSEAGQELSAFLDEALLEVSRPEGTGALRAVGLLALVESAISLWRGSQNVGTVLPWSLR